MAKLTKFTIGPSGDLVYKSTGRLAPKGYTFRKNTVYGPNGRRIGSLSRNLTRTEAAKIAKAERNRKTRAKRAKGKQGKPSQKKPSRTAAAAGTQQYGEDWDSFDNTDFPEEDEARKEEFARRVRDAALSVAPDSLRARIQALSTEAIWQGYVEDAYIFELYFKYHNSIDEPHKSDVSVWLYQFVKRIEQYLGVSI